MLLGGLSGFWGVSEGVVALRSESESDMDCNESDNGKWNS